MDAIPTIYKGIQFRSRLEARYAAYWDIRDTEWNYEPIDLAGYVPDFLIRFDNGVPQVLIEIKPALKAEDLLPAALKIDQSGWTGGARLLGINPSIMMTQFPIDYEDYSKGNRWSPAFPHLGPDWESDWIEAGNIVQWRSPRI